MMEWVTFYLFLVTMTVMTVVAFFCGYYKGRRN
jgi:hypothetical protein